MHVNTAGNRISDRARGTIPVRHGIFRRMKMLFALLTALLTAAVIGAAFADGDSGALDPDEVYKIQLLSRANDLYSSLKDSDGSLTSYRKLLNRDQDSYEDTLRQAQLYSNYSGTMISYTEAFVSVFAEALKGDVEGIANTFADTVADEAMKGVFPDLSLEEFIYTQAWSGSHSMQIAITWDLQEAYMAHNEFTDVNDAVTFILTVQGNKAGLAALKMGKRFYLDQLNTPWYETLGNMAKDFLVSDILGYLSVNNWAVDYMNGVAFGTLIGGLDSLAAEADCGYIRDWLKEVRSIRKETDRLLRMDEDDPLLQPAYQVTFNANGGTVFMLDDDDELVYEINGSGEYTTWMSVHKTARYEYMPRPYLFGYTFDGWFTDREGGTRVYPYSRFMEDGPQTLYAHWTHTELKKGSCGPDLEYTLYADGLLEITGSGLMTDAPWHASYAKRVGEVSLPSGLLSIWDHAFDGCSYLQSINIPDSVRCIGSYAFSDSGLTVLELPSSLEALGSRVLAGNKGVRSLVLPGKLRQMGGWMRSAQDWDGVGAENNIVLQEPSQWPDGMLAESAVESLTFSRGITAIDNYACARARKLSSVTIADTVQSIGDAAFAACGSLKQIYLPDSILSIGMRAFAANGGPIYAPRAAVVVTEDDVDRSGLESLTLPSKVEELGWCLLAGNTKVTSLTIPKTVISAQYVHVGSMIETVTVEAGMTHLPYDIFCYINMDYDSKTFLEEVRLPEGLQIISERAFQNNQLLRKVNLPSTLTDIQDMAFYGCYALKNLEFPDSLNSVGSNAFYATQVPTTLFPHHKKIIFPGIGINNGLYLVDEIKFVLSGSYSDWDIWPSGTEWTTDDPEIAECDQRPMLIPKAAGSTVLRGTLKDGTVEIPVTVYAEGVLALPGKLKEIPAEAFAGTGFSTVNFGYQVTGIGAGAFRDCPALAEIFMPYTITEIGAGAFANCPNLSFICDSENEAARYARENGIPYLANR